MHQQNKYLLYLLMFTLFSCISNLSDKNSVKDESYITENINFYNESAHIRIAGTLTYPKGKGPFPAVILIPGSGNANRDGSDNEIHRPLFEIADYLTNHGMTVLRCDKRGVGDSDGVLDFNTTLVDLASDVKASINFLNNNPKVDQNKLGLIGHSNGGLVAAKVAAELPSISFLVLLASPGIRHGEIVYQQISDIPKAFGINDTTINKFRIVIDSTMIILTSNKDSKIKGEMIEKMYERCINQITNTEIESMSKIGYVFQRNAQIYSKLVMTPFWYEFYTFEPKTILMQIKCPVLSIIGENDLQVSAEKNQTAIKTALEKGYNNKYKLITPNGMNHLFQFSDSGSPEEYFKTKDTMSKFVLDSIGNWISELYFKNVATDKK